MRLTTKLALALWTAAVAEAAQVEFAAKLSVRVYDYAGLSDKAVAEAEALAAHIFRKAGMEIEWIPCPKDREEEFRYPRCRGGVLADDIILHVVPAAMEGYALGRNVFGFALPSNDQSPARQAYVFQGRVERAARQHGRVSVATLLAHVIVHEVGHLLLGHGMHFDRGIMKPRWDPSDLRDMEAGRLIFLAGQARLLRSRVAKRNGSASADRP